MINRDHLHVVLEADEFSTQIRGFGELVATAQQCVPANQLHLLISPSPGTREKGRATTGRPQQIAEPLRRGQAPAIAYAGCQLYRRDPNTVMVFVKATAKLSSAELLRTGFESMVACAELPGAMVTMGAPLKETATKHCWMVCDRRTPAGVGSFEGSYRRPHPSCPAPTSPSTAEPTTGHRESSLLEPTGIYAWSVYALMETYRNYAPVDFQIINEIARTDHHDRPRTRTLYGKLTCADIEFLLLSKIQAGYPTRNVFVNTAMVANGSKVGQTP